MRERNKMARSIRQRRLQSKTDYKARLALLKSQKPRLVIRKTNRYMIAEIVQSEMAQDKVIVGITSKALLEHGWSKDKSGSLKNMAACYLTGKLLAKKSTKVKEAILDFGMNRNIQKSRIYAVLKGVVDGGLKVPHNAKMLPTLEEIDKNQKTSTMFNKLKDTI